LITDNGEETRAEARDYIAGQITTGKLRRSRQMQAITTSGLRRTSQSANACNYNGQIAEITYG
jgi:hypothetical protein